MKVEQYFDFQKECDNCGQYGYIFEITTDSGSTPLTLCKGCLMELLQAIIER